MQEKSLFGKFTSNLNDKQLREKNYEYYIVHILISLWCQLSQSKFSSVTNIIVKQSLYSQGRGFSSLKFCWQIPDYVLSGQFHGLKITCIRSKALNLRPQAIRVCHSFCEINLMNHDQDLGKRKRKKKINRIRQNRIKESVYYAWEE